MNSKLKKLIVPVFLLAFTITFAQRTPRDLRYIDGMRYAEGVKELKDKGYDLAHSEVSGGSMYVNYWNNRSKRCVTIRSYSGRIQSIVEAPNSDCDKGSYTHRNNDNRDYDRSYYHDHNYDDNYRYRRGEQRVHDIIGRSATWAYDELKDRGFREVKSHQDGGKTYRVFYNNRTDQCIKTLSENKRISEVMASNRCD